MAVIPSGNAGINAAQEALKELQKQQGQQSQQPEKSFDSVLNKNAAGNVNQASQTNQVNQATNVNQVNPAVQVNPAQRVNQPNPTEKVNKSHKSADAVQQRGQNVQAAPDQHNPLRKLLDVWSKDTGTMDKIMNIALSGKDFKPGELLVMQSVTAKTSLELDAINKLVETASGAVKTTMQTQV